MKSSFDNGDTTLTIKETGPIRQIVLTGQSYFSSDSEVASSFGFFSATISFSRAAILF